MDKLSWFRKLKNCFHLFNAFLANIFYGFPAKDLKVIGVTGTDGKTTVVHLIDEILKAAEKRVAMISSVKVEIDDKECETGLHVTTPNPWSLQKFLKMAVDKGEEYLVLETTSHALDQHRVFDIPFKIAVLTNITHEHLDYHKTYESYLATKVKLLKRAKVAVVNREDESYKKIKKLASRVPAGKQKSCLPAGTAKIKNIVRYGINQGDITSHNFKFTTPLPGEYNQYNCLAAIAAAKILGIKDEVIKQAVSGFKGVVGRFEFIPTGQDFEVSIDFAHTPNGLKNVLKTVRSQVRGRLIHVFGCAGLRDFKKRPVMGEISAKYADVIILTEEDYRTEDVNEIMDEIEKGVKKNPKFKTVKQNKVRFTVLNRTPFWFRVSNRQEAINKAVRLAKKGDLVLLTGKGHEKSLCRGKKEYPWSEHEAVKKALRTYNKNRAKDTSCRRHSLWRRTAELVPQSGDSSNSGRNGKPHRESRDDCFRKT